MRVCVLIINGRELTYAGERAKYSGEFSGSLKEGQGSQTYADGSEYSGSFFQNKKHGFGKYMSKDGNVYEGEWQGNRMQGKGTFWHKQQGWKYVGEW